jgi:hypothetical protein
LKVFFIGRYQHENHNETARFCPPQNSARPSPAPTHPLFPFGQKFQRAQRGGIATFDAEFFVDVF